MRTSLGAQQVSGVDGAAVLAHVPVPAQGVRVVAVYRGVDAAREPLVAVGTAAITR